MIIEFFTVIMGVAMAIGYYTQAYLIFRNKSAKNVSVTTYVIFSLGTATWFAYGVYTNNIVVMLGFVLGVIGSWLVLILSVIYREKVREK